MASVLASLPVSFVAPQFGWGSKSDSLKRIADELNSQYLIGYTPLNGVKDGGYRKLDVKLSNKDLKAQARKGYYAVKPESH